MQHTHKHTHMQIQICVHWMNLHSRTILQSKKNKNKKYAEHSCLANDSVSQERWIGEKGITCFYCIFHRKPLKELAVLVRVTICKYMNQHWQITEKRMNTICWTGIIHAQYLKKKKKKSHVVQERKKVTQNGIRCNHAAL